MKTIGTYIFRVLSAGLAAVVTLQIAIIFPSQEAGKYFSFMGFTYILSTFFKMGQSYRYLNQKALKSNELLNPLSFLKESFLLTTLIAFGSYIVLKVSVYLLSSQINLPDNYIDFLCMTAYLLALIFNNAEYKRIIGDSFGYVLFSNFSMSIFNLFVFSLLYLMVDNLKAVHAITGFIISLVFSLILGLSVSLWNSDKTAQKPKLNKFISLLSTNIKSGFIFMLYELSEHLQVWAVPIILTILDEYSIIVEYRLAFRMLALISFVPLIVNSNFSRIFGELINLKKYRELKKVLHVVIKKTALGIGIAIVLVYSAYPVVQHLILSNKYMNLLDILIILSFGYVICAIFESSAIILNLQGDKRMLPFFLNLFVFLMVLCSGLFQIHTDRYLFIFSAFSFTMSIKGLLQYYLLTKKLSYT